MTAVTPPPLKRIPPQFPVHPFNTRSVIDSRPDVLWKIEVGFARTITWAEDGTLIVLGIWGAGDWVGRSLTQANPFQIECLTKVKAAPIAINQVPDLANTLLTHVHHLEALMVIRSSKRADVMLLRLLQWLADRFGQTTADGRLIDLRLTHQDLADLIGITRITVTRVLSQLEQQHYIQRLPLQKIILQQEDLWHYEI
ncbi:Crp/Fnr family transcriptional regulator [Leptolyngbya ohadii]|uniref:Crp/Fnr family transcriptional regulator n=1 Tax=Leptolyngbya ohadii TaxID=1962290 RepID=UPI000B59B5CA|nr:Crp/Fnr family transcriptional regulator [Leptolyngbya ohadii]